MGQFDYDLKEARKTTLSLRRLKLLEKKYPIREGCAWITDESILHCFHHHLYENAFDAQCELSHHDARIAFLIKRLQAGKRLDPIHLHISKKKISIFDGAHRLRAHQFVNNDNIEVLLTGSPKRMAKFTEKYNAL
jgi:hypothetical protein